MPSRYIREDILRSKRWNKLSASARELYFRLLLIVDDYGRFYADEITIKNTAYQRMDTIRASDVGRWILELSETKPPMVCSYAALGESFIWLPNTRWKPRSKSKFPDPSPEFIKEIEQLQTIASSCKQLLNVNEDDNDNEDVIKENIKENPVFETLKKEISEFYRRKESTAWSAKEIKTLKEISKRADAEKECRAIVALYRSGYKYARHDIQTLLNNWTIELDRAASQEEKPEKEKSFRLND